MKTITIRAEDLPIKIEIEGYAKEYVNADRIKKLEDFFVGFCMSKFVATQLLKCANRTARVVRDRKAFAVLAHRENYTYKEIAHVLCRDETTIKYYILFPNGRPHRPNKKTL